jgi:predicted transcriptional regulator of viral defense system
MAGELPENLPPTFTIAQAQALGIPEHILRTLLSHGLIERIGRGIYRRLDADPADDDLIEISIRAPGATICLETALAQHDLSDLIPSRPDIAVPRGHRRPPVRIRVNWHQFDPATFGLGRSEIQVDPVTSIGIYNAERSIIDTVRLRHQQGPEVAYQAIRRYFQQRGNRPADLLAMARHFPRTEHELYRILEILLP